MNSSLRKELERSGQIIQTTVGDSMQPMLYNRKSAVVIKKTDGILKKYDLPLYQRPDGKYVLHRILKVRKNDYIICGDNRWKRETVPHDWVIGCTTGYYKDKKLISVDDKKYQTYVHLWCRFFIIRAAILWIKDLPSRIRYKIVKI